MRENDREPGYYWVKYREWWEPAEWTMGKYWRRIGSAICMDAEFATFDSIGPKIEPPVEVSNG